MQYCHSSIGGKYIVCVDSYEGAVMKGRIIHPLLGTETFESLSQFLLKMENALDDHRSPQAFTELRTFTRILQPDTGARASPVARGREMTFELKVFFRQHSSWQGRLFWKEKRTEHNFRSVLELISLMDSALRSEGRSGCA